MPEFKTPIPAPYPKYANISKLPKHVAIIMDGNGRWAQARGWTRMRGHIEGGRRVDEVAESCCKMGIPYLTLYTFSTENWNRPRLEVTGLMKWLMHYLHTMERKLIRNRVSLIAAGHIDQLPLLPRKELQRVCRNTSRYQPRLVLNLCLSYGGRGEIVDACKKLANQVAAGELGADEIDEQKISSSLYYPGIPDPDLIIRTGGESRLSNFLLWQAAYSEIVISETLWPRFNEESLAQAVEEFGNRERRFGKTSAQVTPSS